MKRIIVATIVAAALPLTVSSAHAAPAPHDSTSNNVKVKGSAKADGKGKASVKANVKGNVKANKAAAKAVAKVASKVEATIKRTDAALADVAAQAEARLDADLAAQVRSNIAADVAVLARLSAQVDTAATLKQVNAVRAQVVRVRTDVYTRVVAALETVEAYAEDVEESRASLSLTLTLNLHAGSDLDEAEAALDAAVTTAVSLRASSSNADLAEVDAHLRAAAEAIARSRN